MKKLALLLTIFFVLATFGLFVKVSAASAARFYVSPSSGTVKQNDSITIDIRVDTQGTSTLGGQLILNTEPNKFQFTGYSDSGSPFNFHYPNTPGVTSGGVFDYTFAKVPEGAGGAVPVTGDYLVAKLTFKALASSGTTSLTFSTGSPNGSFVGDNNAGQSPVFASATNGSYTLEAQPTQNPPSGNPPSTPPTSSKPPSSSPPSSTPPAEPPASETPNPADDTAGPVVSDIKVTVKSESEVLVEWKTDEPATSAVDYGETENYGFTDVSSEGTFALSTDHKVTLTSSNLKPDTTYHFRILSIDGQGNTTFSKDQEFSTRFTEQAQLYRYIGLAMIIGGVLALVMIAFFYFRRRGPHPDNLNPAFVGGQSPNLNPPI